MTEYSFDYEGLKVWRNIHSSMKVWRCDRIFIRVSRFQGVTKYSSKYEGFKEWPNIHSSIKVSKWYQIFIWVSRFQCGTKYSFKLDCRIECIIECIIESIIECIIEGIIEGRIIYTVQASKYGCHKRSGSWKQRKGHFRMENWTKASSSSIPCRVCSMQTNSDKGIRESICNMKCQMREQNKEDIYKCHKKFNLIILIITISWISKIINFITFLQNKSDLYFIKSLPWSKKWKCVWKFMIPINKSESQSITIKRSNLKITKST